MKNVINGCIEVICGIILSVCLLGAALNVTAEYIERSEKHIKKYTVKEYVHDIFEESKDTFENSIEIVFG